MEELLTDHVSATTSMQKLASAVEAESLATTHHSPKKHNPYLFQDEPQNPGFPIAHVDDLWETMYLKLKNNIKNGYAFSADYTEQLRLRDWLNRQIVDRRQLTNGQFKKLDALGIAWDNPISRDHAWEVMFTRLQAFRTEFGHCRVPSQWVRDKQLALWVMRQRKMNIQGKILEYRKRLLTEIGFTWEAKEQYNNQWEAHFRKLAAFQQQHGHCAIPGKETKLVSWMERQRLSYKKSLLAPEREKRLSDINFIWDFDNIKQTSWEEKYEKLRKFHVKYGHSFVPVNYKHDRSLGIWVASQRKAEANGILAKAKIERLNKLRFVWSRDTSTRLRSEYDAQWEQNFEKLKAYKKAHRTCQVSLKLDPVLQSWTVWQRRMYYAGKMPADRIRKLDDISFPWSVNEGYWQKMFDMLCAFHERFGHCRVPSQWNENRSLAAWTYRVRAEKYKLDAQQLRSLNALGFEWTIKKKVVEEWSQMYSRLLAFQQEYGHTKVPVRWLRDPKLGKWVSRMRNERSKLTVDRLALLEKIGFFLR